MANSRVKQLGAYLRPHRQQVILGIIALFLVNAVGVYLPLLMRDSIDALGQGFNYEQLWGYVLLILILACVMWAIRMFSRIYIFGIGRLVEFDLKQKIFQHLLRLDVSYFAINNSGDLMSRATSDVDSVRSLLGFALLSLVNTFFAYSLTLPVMLSINARLSLMAIAVYPLMLIAVQLFSGKLRQQQQDVQEKLSDLSSLITEDMSGMALIKIYAQETQERLAFAQKNRRLLQANLKLARTRNLLFPLVEGLSYLSLLVLLIWGSGTIESGIITIGDFVALIIFVERLVFPTALLGFTITAYQRGEVSIDRIEAILNAETKIEDAPSAYSLPKAKVKGEITARGLTYTYPGAKNPAIKNLNFTITAGETVAIVGPIGSGKSTLANAFPRLLDIPEGQLFLDGLDVTKLKLSDLRSSMSYVPQDSFLFGITIENNIRYGDPLREKQEVVAAAVQAQIHEEVLNFPQQYETMVGERGITLSGGQRQRTSLARALLMAAPILILDDALSSVDNQTATRILNYLSTEKSKTVIFISHQLSAAATADKILVMDHGEIVQSGTHSQLVEKPGLYQSLWQQHQLLLMVDG
ncbi:MAG: ABC transporter ATP-binding protein [Gomphosphaeria aponina SAG 52.96 = DSM 107014]|uniref:ABC transporter ATP-binding protein n=1 Tax=Gomphosphaeria aponina SAG 52.96 = DSM 107014 TaxID=1521640 RepID=A0A941JMW7_9CHRO|nr:ABC transporter ATP-binding protein [Gomphosphaeria aponina SAG 52.96 = DSM 107014]